jgi:hypothetical protein
MIPRLSNLTNFFQAILLSFFCFRIQRSNVVENKVKFQDGINSFHILVCGNFMEPVICNEMPRKNMLYITNIFTDNDCYTMSVEDPIPE